jgi:glucose-1-phosphate adenylyltransferase
VKNVLAVVLAGGAGARLHPLTRHRAKPAVPFGGVYRIIDFTLSNCVNSNLFRIQVLTQYKSQSLSRHLRLGWNSLMRGEFGEYIELIPPQRRVGDSWYQGTADAVYQNMYSIERENPREVLILSGDHVYKMDYHKMVRFHRKAGADLTVAVLETDTEQASRFGVLEVDGDHGVIGFEEKPESPRHMPGTPDKSLASMGVYVFNTDVLNRELVADAARGGSSHDFGKDIIPSMISKSNVRAYNFRDENRKSAEYWRDIGTIDAYWEANMDLISVDPVFNLYDSEWQIRTNHVQGPPAKFVFAEEGRRFGVAVDSIVSNGCIISGGMVRRSVLSPWVRINSYSLVQDSVLFDRVNIGRYARVRKAIIEKDVTIPPGAVIGYDEKEDAKRFRVTDSGVVVVEKSDLLWFFLTGQSSQ